MNWIKKRQAEFAQPATDNAESVQPQRLTSDVNTFLASFDSLLHKIANKYKGALVDHDDLVQEARIAIANAYDKYDGNNKATPKTFFSNVAKNAMLNAINKENRRQKKQISTENEIGENLKLEDVLPDETVPASEQGEFDKVLYRENPQEFKARVKTFLDSLNPQDRRIMQYHFDGVPPSKIAEKQGVTEKDPRKIKARIKKLNQKMIDDMGIMPHETKDGTEKTTSVTNVAEIKDEDFINPTRSIQLPSLPENVLNVIGKKSKPVLLKKNILEKNRDHHKELSADDSRKILEAALYHSEVIGQSQPNKRPNYWVAVKLNSEKNAVAVLDMEGTKNSHEIVGWRFVNSKGLQHLQNQAIREGGQFLDLQQKVQSPSDHTGTDNTAITVIQTDKNASDIAEKNQEKFHITRKRKQINPIVQAGKVRDNYQDLLENKEYTPETIEQWDKKAVEYILI